MTLEMLKAKSHYRENQNGADNDSQISFVKTFALLLRRAPLDRHPLLGKKSMNSRQVFPMLMDGRSAEPGQVYENRQQREQEQPPAGFSLLFHRRVALVLVAMLWKI